MNGAATRRDFLTVGSLGPLGFALPQLLAAESTPDREGFGRAKSCIVLFLFGAPAHQDLWDLKPDAPAEVRGEFKPIATRTPGILVGEHLPHTAKITDRLALIRSVSHPDNTHTVAMHAMLTGHRHIRPGSNPQNEPTDFPTFGAVMQRLRPNRGALPAGVSLNAPANQVSAANHIFPGFFAGFLGRGFDPLFVAQDPSRPEFRPFPVAEGADADRLIRRRELLEGVDRGRGSMTDTVRALDLVTSPAARRAFDISEESVRLRDRYGWSPFGQGCLLARRLVESGVRLVTVNWARDDAFWDTHADNFKLLKNSLLPPFDRGFSTLIEDLHQRGTLDETLVVCLGEFGRTPSINRAAGRDHWAACNTVVLAGAGIRGGTVYGASDKRAAYPVTAPVTPADLAATIYHALGVDVRTTVSDQLGRPLALSDGTALKSLFAS